jgi:mediator of RNA polymerase II transcription subunit 7
MFCDLIVTFSFADRRPALLSILKSTLITYSALIKALLAPPPPPGSDAPPDWQRHVEWITILAQNIIAATNDLRPVQVCSMRRNN